MRRLAIMGLMLGCACGAQNASRQGSPRPPTDARHAGAPATASAEPRPAPAIATNTSREPPAPVSPAPETIPAHRFEPARRYVEETKLSLYRYHEHQIGKSEGYLAPIVLTADGGFLVVGTRADYPGGK